MAPAAAPIALATVDEPAAPAPIFAPAEHLDLHVRRFRGRLARHRLLRAAGTADVSGELASVEHRLARLEAELAARLAVSDPELLPIEQLQRRFGLTDLGLQLLIAAAAPGLDLTAAREITALNADRTQCEVGFLCEVLADNALEHDTLLD
ncbi:MAG TPA: hypothetical protein VFP84_08135, partial [Kofleriaceae bacterium]|nr:hypothetical protein [Kofleriaceae bacterium]